MFDPVEEKLIISRDVVVDEEATWDWTAEAKKNYTFYPFTMDESDDEPDTVTHVTSPPSHIEPASPEGESSESLRERPQKYRRLEEIYEETTTIEGDELTLYCHFIDSEPVDVEEAMKNEKWKKAMDEEIGAIEKNKTWELVSLPEN
ncbi:unnamed protein product [Linum trigynum]|uniref:Uncharacterized protein n=1 Tax=Linum trigynum TaxID=586398 RepID=A0AAV2GIC4_9ROSI